MTPQESRHPLDSDFIIAAYRNGYFPMADSRTGVISWYSPDPRAIIPLGAFRISRSLRRLVKKRVFEIKVDTAFQRVIRGCARREDTWISEELISSYIMLHEKGHAHSVESWRGGELVGGLYGLAIAGGFFGESMFSTVSGASKVALVHLVELLSQRGFKLLDTQFMNEHVRQFGAIEIPRAVYLSNLHDALTVDVAFLESSF
jgi:leucyl/phenylalanyl-tRNA--protein transferase